MFDPYLKIILITLFSMIGTLFVNIRRFRLRRREKLFSRFNIKTWYECLNCHLTLSLGMLGFAWGNKEEVGVVYILFLFFFVGILPKAAFSTHNPDSFSLKDRDAMCGLWIPVFIGVSSVIFMLLVQYFANN